MRRIEFNKNKFCCVICLNADLPDISIFDKIKDLPILCADGAANRLIQLGIIPNYVIGDLDSCTMELIKQSIPENRIIKISEQETNDFEKNLKFAIESGFKNILIIGFHGGDLEHTLNNWSVFKRFSEILNLVILDKNRYAFTLNESASIQSYQNEIISLIPQPEAVLTTENLRWELNNEALELGYREGARNISLADEIVIKVHSGQVLVFMDERLPYTL